MYRLFITLVLCVLGFTAVAEVPDVNDYRPVPQYPDPAMGASLTLGAALSNGRLVLWDGDNVYLQDRIFTVQPTIPVVASGYVGDPAFVAINSNSTIAVLGSGPDGILYRVRPGSPEDFVAGDELLVPDHFAGTLLSNSLVILDRVKDDMSGAELVVVDISVARAGVPIAAAVVSNTLPEETRSIVVDKPVSSGTAMLYRDVSRGRLYATDPFTGEVRYFSVSSLISAFNNAEMLDWNTDGTLVGTAGQFLNGGVGGVNRDRERILGGDMGMAGTGGIQFVDDADPPAILATLDPAGTGPPYIVFFNRALDDFIAIDPSVMPPVAYATETTIPPIPSETPCDIFDQIDTQFALFLLNFSPDSGDLDMDTIPDQGMLELIELFSCRGIGAPLVLSSNQSYDTNLDVFAAEASFAALSDYVDLIPVLMMMNQAMQDAVRAILSTNGTPLGGTYSILMCTDPENCIPDFVEDPDPMLRARGALPTFIEQYAAMGDPDGDGLTNLEEYMNVVEMGGDIIDYAIAAASARLNGGPGVSSGDASGGGCFIATAAYGTPLAGEIGTLRVFRDRFMLSNAVGTAVSDIYYRVSPTLATSISQRDAARQVARVALTPIVALAHAALAAPGTGLATLTLLTVSALFVRRRRTLQRNE